MSENVLEERRRSCPISECTKPEDAAHKAVKQVFDILGVNIDNAKEVEEFRKVLRFSGAMLNYSNKGKLATFLSLIAIATGFVVHAIFNHQ